MAGLNKVQLIGHLGADPEARSLNNGGEVVTLRLATSESWKDRDGNRQERTEWHSVVCFNENLGRILKQYTRKGSKVYVEGQLQTRKWTDNNGNDRYTTEVVMQKFRGEVVLLDSAKGDGRYDDDSYSGGHRGGGGRQQRRDDSTGEEQQGGLYDETRDAGGGGQGGGRKPKPQPAAFDDDLDDDVPF